MKTINTYILEKLKISKPNKIVEHTLFPKSRGELVDIIKYQTKINGNECSLNHIDVSNIENMAYVFNNANKKFNGDISQWDVSKVKDMSAMFMETYFNGDISDWNVSNVEEMSWMFQDSKFNGDISDWDVSNVRAMTEMFERSDFNQPIGKWNPSKLTEATFMFAESKFNQDISRWDLFNCKTTGMFLGCHQFNKKYKPQGE